MKKIAVFLLVILFSNWLNSQDCSVVEDPELIKEHQIKSISTRLISISDLKDLDSLEVVKIDFDENGNKVYEKFFKLFDVIQYSLEYNYVYNKQGNLTKKLETQLEYPKSKRDSMLLKLKGFGPSIKKWTYEYDQDGNLIQENAYLDDQVETPTLISNFHYSEKGERIKGEFKNINNPSAKLNSNRIEYYQYDELNRLIKVDAKLTNNNVSYQDSINYDELGNKVFESRIFNSGTGSIQRFYYENNNLTVKENYQASDKNWFSKIEYEYSELGVLSKMITSRRNGWESITSFESNSKGLFEYENWYTSKGEKAFFFKTEYEYSE